MSPLIFDTTKHFTADEQLHLRALAAAQGVSVDDLIERTMKQRIYGAPAPASAPHPQVQRLFDPIPVTATH